jgi:ribonuclease HI
MLHLVSSSPLTDPEAWAILQTFRDARDLGNACQLESMLGLFSQGGEGLPHNGPTSVLLSRLHRIGWAVGGQGLVQDRFGTFSVSHVAWDELVLRFKFAWGRVLADEVAHRPTFNGIEHVDLPELYRALQEFGPVDLVYLRCHLDGTLFTQNGRAKFDSTVSATCPWCPAKDGFHHRAWDCPHFAPCRRHLTAEQLAVVGSLPSCLVDHGWPVVLPEWEIFVGLLLRADGFPRVSPVVPPVASEVSVDLFTDGSGAYPREPKLRFAAWAITMVPAGIGTLDNRLILAGHVNGIIQTPYRAELTAVLAAITWASQRQQRVRLWCDCQGVVSGLRRILRRLPIKRNRPHSDLWNQLDSLVGSLDQGMVQIYKVVSHGQISQATGPIEEWAYWHNHLTDLAAAEVNQRRSPDFWAAWAGLKQALAFHRSLHGAILKLLLMTSRMAAADQPVAPKPRPLPVEPAVEVPVAPQTWQVPPKFIQRYGHINMQHLHAWWSQTGGAMLQGDGPLAFISGIQIFMAFNLHTEFTGPWCHKKRWYGTEEAAPISARLQWGARCQWFLRMWKSYMKANQVLIPTRMTRPCSASVSRWTVCYRMKWSQRLLDGVDEALLAQNGRQITSTNDVNGLMAAKTG